MNIKFYPRDLNKEKGKETVSNELPIWCCITFNKRRIRFSTQIKVNEKDWNPAKQKIRGGSTIVDDQNQRLKDIRRKAEEVEAKYMGKVLTEDALRNHILPVLFPDRAVKSEIGDLSAFLQHFIKKNPKDIKEGSMKSYLQLEPILTDFSKKHGKSMLAFNAINASWGEAFTKFLKTEKKHSINTVDKHTKNIKALMSYALKKEIHQNFKFEHIRREKDTTKEIYLNTEEIKAIYHLEVSEEYQASKDIFVFSCLTGLRISDILSLKKHNWKGEYIELETKKTEDKLEIPLQKPAKKILQKYNGVLPTMYEQKYNKQLKDICELVPALQCEEIVYSTKGGVREQKSVYKYELVKSHTGRRSYATNEYLAGTDPLYIRAITGHKTEKDFFNYIKIDQKQKATSLLEIYKNRKDF